MEKKRKYRLGLALSGGGVRGFAHLGVLYAMEELGIKPDIIAGVSAGSVVASLYGSGMAPLDIMKQFYYYRFKDFCKVCLPKEGFFSMEGFHQFLTDNLLVERLEDCPIPTVIGATDIAASKPVQWREGVIADRVCASCSLPIVFNPVTIDGVEYVDGGVLHNLPAWAIREECDILIGVNVSPIIKKGNYTGSILDVAIRTYHLMARANSQTDATLCDVVISTDSIADLRVFKLKEKERIFKSGYKSAKSVLLEAKEKFKL
ncbi:MAG: patatin-like phospholipase family protein [Bacteroides sp.]|nr:patatin-like phospholipase family protein [Bacteroides sp.]MBD5285775.1 patatin-like phospholipase family protein [Bacteroides sp.]